MRIANKTRVMAIMLTLISPAFLGIMTPSSAEPGLSTALIDKDFETALRKHISRRFFNRIEASTEQQEKLSKIMTETQEETRPLREQLRQGLLDLSVLMVDDKNSDKQIEAKVHELRALHEKVQDKRLSAALKARTVLNAEQRQKIQVRFKELIAGGLSPRKIGMLMRSGPTDILGD